MDILKSKAKWKWYLCPVHEQAIYLPQGFHYVIVCFYKEGLCGWYLVCMQDFLFSHFDPKISDVFLCPQRTYGLVDTESHIHSFLQIFETRGLLAISLKRPWTVRRRKRKSRDLGFGRRWVLSVSVWQSGSSEERAHNAAFVCRKVVCAFGFQVSSSRKQGPRVPSLLPSNMQHCDIFLKSLNSLTWKFRRKMCYCCINVWYF